MFVVNIIFMDIPYINIFFIIDYFLLTLIDSVEFFINFIFPVFRLEENPLVLKISHYLYTPLILKLSTYNEVIVAVTIFYEFTKRKKKNIKKKFLYLFIFHLIFINLKNFIVSDFFYDYWMKINIKIRNKLLMNKAFFKNSIEKLLDAVTSGLRSAREFTQSRDIKVHTE